MKYTERLVQELKNLGCKYWENGANKRLYLSLGSIGIGCDYHKTGSIRNAWYTDGSGSLSNNQASRLVGEVRGSYVDLITGGLYATSAVADLYKEQLDRIVEELGDDINDGTSYELDTTKYEEVEMFYGDYKSNYSHCATKDGSYNYETKTIIVLVPIKSEEEKAEEETLNTFTALYNPVAKANGYPEITDIKDAKLVYDTYTESLGQMSPEELIEKAYEFNPALKRPEAIVEEAKEEPVKVVEEPEEVEIPYKDYKDYAEPKHLKKVPDTYNSWNKTICVYMTATQKEAYESWKQEKARKAQEEEAKWQVVEMPYKDWKKSYSKYKKWDYNSRTGTVQVKIPVTMTYEPKDKHYVEKHEFRAGYTDALDIVPDMINPDDITVEIPEELINKEI